MKKIMFNDRYGLTQAVLEGRKTMTRRLMTMTLHKKNGKDMTPVVPDDMFIASDGKAHFQVGRNSYMVPKQNQPAYYVGEEVAIAQPYKNDDVLTYNAYNEDGTSREEGFQRHKEMLGSKGYRNKMFVKADLMPHRIRITGIKAERLRDISNEDCLCEGIRQSVVEYGDKKIVQWTYFGEKITTWYDSPRDAFAALIDRISGRGTWQRNPWVYAYTFELIK